MPKHARYAVGFCDNDARYPELLTIRSHVKELKFHRWPKDPELAEIWRKQLAKGRRDDFNRSPGSSGTFVCSNHFTRGERTPGKRETDYPTLFLTTTELLQRQSPKKRNAIERNKESTSKEPIAVDLLLTCQTAKIVSNRTLTSHFEFLYGLSSSQEHSKSRNTQVFPLPKHLFEYLMPKASRMQYWRGVEQTRKETPAKKADDPYFEVRGRPGPARKLDLPQELLLKLMRLKLGLLIDDLAFRFIIVSTTASSIFITWIKLMSKELSVLIIWPDRSQVRKTLPACFKALYPKVRCIIDCFECFTEKPSSLDLAAALWSEYKHHYTYKVLVVITPNGAISYVSHAYGGRASDVFIVRDSGFLRFIEPYDQIMADRGFKIREDLMMTMATLCIPPSCAASMQMLPEDLRKTSNIANVRIYVEQAIGRLKVFRILKQEMPITLLPMADDIVRVCCALCNFLPPLCNEN